MPKKWEDKKGEFEKIQLIPEAAEEYNKLDGSIKKEVDKGSVSEDFSVVQKDAIEKAHKEYEIFRIIQDKAYISEFDRRTKQIEKQMKESE